MTIENFLQSSYFWPLILWSLAWKGFALWRAGTMQDKGWFIAIFLINTFGILEISYIFHWSKRQRTTATS